MEALTAGLDDISQSPKATGVLELIVRRPQTEAREVLELGELDLAEGLVGDNWKQRGSSQTADGSANPDTQLTLTNARLMALVGPRKAALAPSRGSAIRRLRPKRGQHTPRDSSVPRRGCDPNHRATPHRLQKICRPLWAGRPEICQFPGGQTASATRRQRQGHSPGCNTGWRRREETLSVS